jgi:hypothetical protein
MVPVGRLSEPAKTLADKYRGGLDVPPKKHSTDTRDSPAIRQL